jgi:hypothetical protein
MRPAKAVTWLSRIQVTCRGSKPLAAPIFLCKEIRVARILNNSTCCGLSELDSVTAITTRDLETIIPSCRTMVIATVNQYQRPAKKVLQAYGFKTLKRFRNRNSGNIVYLMGYDKSAKRS